MNHRLVTLALLLFLAPRLEAQFMKTNATPENVLYDFTHTTNLPWQIVNDDVMGGMSASSFRITNVVATVAEAKPA